MTNEEIMKMLPKAPADIEKWIKQECIKKSYIIYDNKKDEAVCTRCGKRFKVPSGATHNHLGACPKCQTIIEYKSAGRGRQNLTEYFRVVLYTHKGNTVWVTLAEVDAIFTDFGTPNIKTWFTDIYSINGADQHHYKRQYGGWGEVDSTRLPMAACGISMYGSRYDEIHLYTKNIKNVFTKSCLKYLWVPDFIKELTEYSLLTYVSMASKYDSIEKLVKVGLHRLAKAKLNGGVGTTINIRGKTLEKIVKLHMKDIHRLAKEDAGPRELKLYQKLTPKERNALTWEKIEELATNFHIEEILKNTTVIQWAKYASTQPSSDSWKAGLWLDYIKMAKKLGYDLDKKKVKYPPDLKDAHDEAGAKLQVLENEELDRKIKERIKYVEFENDELVMYPATSHKELIIESSKLKHCVKTYADKVAEGRCIIWFIRKKEDVETSYYTMETTPKGQLVQCRGMKNCAMTEEVKAFVDEVIEKLKRRKVA